MPVHAYPPCDHDECPPTHCLRKKKGTQHEVTTPRPAPADRGMTAGAGQFERGEFGDDHLPDFILADFLNEVRAAVDRMLKKLKQYRMDRA